MIAYTQIASNKRKTWWLIGSFLIVMIGFSFIFEQVYRNPQILVIGVLFSTVMSLVSYYYSDKITLAISRARPADKNSYKELYRAVENLTIASGLPMPKVYIIDDQAMNAFATGRDPDHAAVCVTAGLYKKMNKSELEGVLAHELSHVGNYDIRLSTVIVILVGILTLLADWFLRFSFWGGRKRDRDSGSDQLQTIMFVVGIILAIFAPIAATIIQLAISRKREYLADASGALLTRYPEGLASALEKIKQNRMPLEEANKATAHLYIVNPLKGSENEDGNSSTSWWANLFNTHPPLEDRIKKLREINL